MKPADTDPIVERFARVNPPAGHGGRIRERSGPGSQADLRRIASAGAVPWRWALPVAATLVVAGGVVWQSDRTSRQVWFDTPQPVPYWSGKGVDMPVLPPRAYWTMSAFEEFDRLRSEATSAGAIAPTRSAAVTRTDAEDMVTIVAENANAEPPWSPLPPIELEDIAPAPLEVPAITGLEPLVLEPIEIAPIDIIPVDKEQR